MTVRPLLLALLLTTTAAGATPLAWEQTSIEVRLTPGMETAEAIFQATNQGRETVRFSRFQSSCGCTAVALEDPLLEPGETASIKAVFTREGRQGVRRNRIQVFTDDATEPTATLVFTVDIPRLLSLQPAVIFWTPNAAPAPRTVTIELDGSHLTELAEVKYARSVLEVGEPTPGAKPHQFNLSLQPLRYDQALRETVQIIARGPDGFEEEVRLQIFVQP